jgi:hypothetical protein
LSNGGGFRQKQRRSSEAALLSPEGRRVGLAFSS